MKRFLLALILSSASSLIADLNTISSIASEALKDADVVIIGTNDENGSPTAIMKGRGPIVQRYSFKDIPVRQFPQNGQVFVFTVTDGIFIDRPEIEQKVKQKILDIE